MQDKKVSIISDLLKKVAGNETGVFERTPELIAVLPEHIAALIGDSDIYLSEFVIAKVQGKIKGLQGHPKITDEVFKNLPSSLAYPSKILRDVRKSHRKEYLFINLEPLHQVVVEVERKPNGLSEINTLFDTTSGELKRLEGKLPTVFSSGETPSSRIHASP